MPLHSMASPVYGISMADIASQIGYCKNIHRAILPWPTFNNMSENIAVFFELRLLLQSNQN